ncbi:hypothetical protein H5410_000767 [Solanum commersonii]|uniref:Uncharacterized protein n=1 Tax=Solanum commersonii TaxID=4109 RepID=A0A9J6AXP6_SOLCO|nr:hypothetical protein H5410_000767 [Solanum commersonii]
MGGIRTTRLINPKTFTQGVRGYTLNPLNSITLLCRVLESLCGTEKNPYSMLKIKGPRQSIPVGFKTKAPSPIEMHHHELVELWKSLREGTLF